MKSLFRMLRRGLGLREFTRDELDLLADVYEGRLGSLNHLTEHKAELYIDLREQRLIYLEQFKGKGGAGVEIRFDLDEEETLCMPVGTWRLSPAAPTSVVEMIQAHIAAETRGGQSRVTARQRKATSLIESRRRLPMSSQKRICVLWHLAHEWDSALAPVNSARQELVAPPSVDAFPKDSRSWPRIALSDDEVHAILNELLETQSLSAMRMAREDCRIDHAASEMWEFLAMNLYCKVKVAIRLRLADAFSQDQSALVEWRKRDRAESDRRFAEMMLNDIQREAIHKALADKESRVRLLFGGQYSLPLDKEGKAAKQINRDSVTLDAGTVGFVLMEELDRFALAEIRTAADAIGCDERLDERWRVWALPRERLMDLWVALRGAERKSMG